MISKKPAASITLPSDFEDLLYELNSADGLFTAIVVYDTTLRSVLETAGLLKRNARGGCYGAPLLDELMNDDNALNRVIKHLEDAGISLEAEKRGPVVTRGRIAE